MRRPKQKDGKPVGAPALSRAVPAGRGEPQTRLDPLAIPGGPSLTQGSRPAIGRPIHGGHAVLERRLDGTDLLCPVTPTPQAQRFSSTAVYPTMRGQTLSCLSTLAARALRDTLLPR